MIYNYFKTAFRFLSKHLSFTLINVVGLTTGIAAFLLIALYLQHELSYDKHFPYADRTYRMVGIQEPRGLDKQHVAITSGPWAGFLMEHVPDVAEAFRVMPGAPVNVEVGDEVFRETNIFYAEGNILKYFGLPVVHGGGSDDYLSRPNQAAISREVAQRFFDRDDVLGETIRNGNQPYTITAVFDREGIRSHVDFDILLSLETVIPEISYLSSYSSNSLTTYIVLQPSGMAENVERIVNEQYENLLTQEDYSHSIRNTFYLQNVKDIYLRSGHIKFHMRSSQGNIHHVYIFSLVAFLIIVIACINFINLATANSAKRAREVGLRKVLGASRMKLAMQFIGESMLITLFSLLLALVVIELILPEFNSMLGTELTVGFFSNPLFNLGLLVILLFVGFISGFYPAMYLSRFQAVEVLKSQSGSGRPKAVWLRKVLVVSQFLISTAMIMVTLVVMSQVHYMRTKDRGYDPENVIALPMGHGVTYDQIVGFRNHLQGLPEIQHIGIASNYNGVAGNQGDITVADSVETRQMVRYGFVDPDFFPTMDMEIIQGRNFSHESGTDSLESIIINEATARALGWDDPIGRRFIRHVNDSQLYLTVIGVVKDYHYYSLHNPIEPAVYIFYPDAMPMLVIRYSGQDPQGLLSQIETEFKSFFPKQHFHSWFVDDVLDRQIRTEDNMARIFTWFAVLCMVISCLGLFGLTSYMVNQRRKEISIRKVMGATVGQINFMLLTGFLRWVAIAAAIALPLAFLFLGRWLSNYPYRISIGVVHVGLPLVIIVVIAAVTVLVISSRASMQNPAKNLKYE